MKKLLYMGLSALMMLLALMGVGKAQTVTFSPASGTTVPDGQEIAILISGNGNFYYGMYASMEDAQQAAAFDMDPYDAEDANLLKPCYNESRLVIEPGKRVIRIGRSWWGEWTNKDIYAEYTIGEREQTITFSPAPEEGDVTEGTTITITAIGVASTSVFYNTYASSEAAQNDNLWSDPNNRGSFTAFRNHSTLVISADKPVIRVGILNADANAWIKNDIYAAYTIAGSETPGPDEPEKKDTVKTPTFSIVEGAVAITCATDGAEIHYTTNGSTPDASSTSYSTPIAISYPSTTIKAIAIKSGMENSKVADTTCTTSLSMTITFNPQSGSTVRPNTECTITGNHNARPNDYFYYKTYASKDAAEAETWPVDRVGISNLKSMMRNATFPPTINLNTANRVIKIAASFNSEAWSDFTYAEYTIATKPVFSITDEEVPAGTIVTISAFEGASIYYTTNESTPDAQSTPYTDAGITINQAMTIKAIAIKDNVASDVTTASFRLSALPIAPAFSKASGTVQMEDTVIVFKGDADSIFVAVSNDRSQYGTFLKYTTNDTIVIANDSTFVHAYAIKGGIKSDTADRIYSIEKTPVEPAKPAAPEFSVAAGQVDANSTVTIAKGTADSIFVAFGKTVAEAAAFAKHTADVTVTIVNDTVIRAYAMKDGKYSDTIDRAYTVKTPEQVTLTLDPADGSTINDGDGISITCSNSDCNIIYAYYASREEAEADTIWAKYGETGTINNIMFDYNYGRNKPTPTVGKNVLRVGAWLADAESFVATAYAEYTIEEGGNEEPIVLTFTPASGAEVEEGDTVKIECSNEETVVYFMMFDTKANAEAISDEDWQDGMIEYGEPIEDEEGLGYPVITKEKPVIKAGYAIVDEEENITWNFTYAVYTVKEGVTPDPDTVETPIFSVEGEVEKGTKVTISCTTTGAKIYYTVNGDVPTAQSTEYTAQIVIDSAMTIKAIAVKEGSVDSKVAEASYTIKKVANEGAELAGVRLYPNPNNGEFNVSVPVRVQVEVFTVNGMLVKDMTIAQGNTQIRLENSGIYFVRFTAENGQAAVKRVIVR